MIVPNIYEGRKNVGYFKFLRGSRTCTGMYITITL